MEEKDIMEIWKSYDQQLEQDLRINNKNAEDITKIKIKSALASMRPLKIFTLLVGIIWTGIGSFIIVNLFIHAFDKISLFFLFSAAIQLTLTAIAVVIYIYQLITIQQINISDPIFKTQRKLAGIKVSSIWAARVLFLQLPVWTTFYLSKTIFITGGAVFYSVQGIITLLFTYLAVWLFFNIKYENRNKKWFRIIFNGREWNPVMQSVNLLNQLKEIKTEHR